MFGRFGVKPFSNSSVNIMYEYVLYNEMNEVSCSFA